MAEFYFVEVPQKFLIIEEVMLFSNFVCACVAMPFFS